MTQVTYMNVPGSKMFKKIRSKDSKTYIRQSWKGKFWSKGNKKGKGRYTGQLKQESLSQHRRARPDS